MNMTPAKRRISAIEGSFKNRGQMLTAKEFKKDKTQIEKYAKQLTNAEKRLNSIKIQAVTIEKLHNPEYRKLLLKLEKTGRIDLLEESQKIAKRFKVKNVYEIPDEYEKEKARLIANIHIVDEVMKRNMDAYRKNQKSLK